MKLENIDIVMVGTTHPGNIGAAARAMNNMCLSRLSLVDAQCPVGEIAYARASGAHSILDNRRQFSTLQEAIADRHYAVASSARLRSLPWPLMSPVEMAQKFVSLDDDTRIALVFGREHSGLTNEEIQLCHAMAMIPTNPDFSSLNIAAAIQVFCYEIYRHHGAEQTHPPQAEGQDRAVTSAELEAYFEHLHEVLVETRFLNPQKPGQIMQRLRRLYLRSEPSLNEINILRGILSAVEKRES